MPDNSSVPSNTVVTVVGARPQFVKLAPVSRLLREKFREVLVHTGQHYDYEMSRLFFEQLSLREPAYHLGVGSGQHGRQLAEMIKGIEEVLLGERPAGVIVYGDTNSTLAGALAAAKLSVPVAHIEAGLRSFNRRMPEEINRVLTDHVSSLLFAPTTTAVSNLAREGITEGVFHTGDVMCDALQSFRDRIGEPQSFLGQFNVRAKQYCVATIHRAENTDDRRRLSHILLGLNALHLPVVFPVHPRTRGRIGAYGLEDSLSAGALRPVEPQGYVEMLALQEHAACVVTDSGGMQKEAYLLGSPCVTVRDETEWVETIEAGWNLLVPAEAGAIVSAVRSAIQNGRPRRPLDHEYGVGDAGERIVGLLSRHWGGYGE
jgi:UDP-GlcNAc3NAcA epimerase